MPHHAARRIEVTASRTGVAHGQLRAATSAIHRDLDSHFDLAGLTTPAGYIRFLKTNWPVVAVESALTQAGIASLLPDWELRRRGEALIADLMVLGVPLPEVGGCSLESNIGTLLGWSYVTEGSKLGARYILRGLRPSLPLELSAATRFLSHEEDRDSWSTFKFALAGIDDNPIEILRACRGARAAFGAFLSKSHAR